MTNTFSDQASKSKPDPHNAEYICEQLGVKCSEAIMVRLNNIFRAATMCNHICVDSFMNRSRTGAIDMAPYF